MVAGLVEGAGLLVFQRINWRSWGPMMHVSKAIIWVSPLVDLLFFVLLALLVTLLAAVIPRLNAVRTIVSLLAFLTIYDWLTLTARLSHWSCALLALGVAAAFNRWFGKRETGMLKRCKQATPWLIVGWVVAFVAIQGGEWIVERRTVARLPAADAGSPNVLIIVVDTLRADHLSSYGYARQTSPEIDRIAKEGVRFENAIAPSSWSLPSHASLLTGRYPFDHVMQNVEPMPWLGWDKESLRGFPTLGEMLQKRGYRTGAFSANRVYFTSNVGLGRGFIHFEDYFHSPADCFVRTLFGREFARIYLSRSDKSLVRRILRHMGFTSLLDRDTEGWEKNGGARGVRKRAGVVNDELSRWIDTDKGQQHPFFAFLNYMDAHDPYGAPASYPKPSWDHGTVTDQYDEGVSYADHYLGLLMQSLQQRRLMDHTLVIITSDHGESLGEHGLHFHASALYRELIRVPLIIWYPGHVPPGLQITTPVTNVAIPATIMDLLGGELDARSPGEVIFPGPALNELWQNSHAALRWPHPLAELAQNAINPQKAAVPTAADGPMQSLVTADWHLIVHKNHGEQLYRWNTDPGEADNLINTPEGRAEAAALRLELDALTKGSMP
jgi:arylsulfatase A-like enzyme